MAGQIIVAGLVAGGIAVGVTTAVAPPHVDNSTSEKAAIQRQESQLSSADSKSKRRMREEAAAGIDADQRERHRAAEHRPPLPRFRLRLP